MSHDLVLSRVPQQNEFATRTLQHLRHALQAHT